MDQNILPTDHWSLPEQEQEESLPLMEYLQLLWFRRWSIIAITVLSGIAGWVWVNQQTPIYRATATMMLGTPSYGPNTAEMMMLEYLYDPDASDEIQVLKSQELAIQVVERLDLLSYPEFNPVVNTGTPEAGLFDALHPREWLPESWQEIIKTALDRTPSQPGAERAIEQDIENRQLMMATNILLGGLELTNVDYSNVIMVGYKSTNAVLAAKIANDFPEAYMVSMMQAKYDATEKASKWLSEQLAELRQEVENAERAVEIYRSEHRLTEVAGTGLLAEQLSELNSQMIIARAERAEAEARLNQLRQLLLQGSIGAETVSRLTDSSLIQQLRTSEIQAQKQVSELAVEFGPRHPRMLQAQAELVQVRDRIQAEINKVEMSLRSDIEFARAREASLQASLDEAEMATGEQNRESIQLRALEREAAASRALFETFLEQFKQTSSAEGLNEPGARVLSKAQVPGGPFYPNVRRHTTTIAMAGFIVAVLMVLGIDALNPGLTNPEQVEKEMGVYAMGILPMTTGKTGAHDFPLDQPHSLYVEALNTLKVSLALTDPDTEPRVIQVTSSLPEEGKTTLAVSLARVLASQGASVILVDGDLRRSAIEHKLGIDIGGKGLTDLVLANDSDLEPYLVKDPRSSVRLMPSGTAEFVNATDVFSSQRMERVVQTMREQADYVIFDAPPVMAVADARLIGRLVEKTLFVVRWNKTPKKVIKAALTQLHKGGTDIAGIVLQQVDLKRYGRMGHGGSGYYFHYGRYGQYYNS